MEKEGFVRTLKQSIVRVALITAGILLIPLVAMQFSSEMNWSSEDFVAIGLLIFMAGMAYELISKKLRGSNQRLLLCIAIAVIVVWLWAELAVGIFTNWGS
jgi:peptidoglycan/LPS O-acetylase OafA/YrhL